MAKAKAAGSKARWRSLTGGLGYMGISLKSRLHTGAGLAAMVEWILQTGRFERLRIGLSDTLNRHNIAHEQSISLTEAFQIATQQGNLWLDENRATLAQITIPTEFVRWSFWLETHAVEVAQNKAAFERAYQHDAGFRDALNTDMARFAQRKSGVSLAHLDRQSRATSFNYLIEELAVYSVIFKDYPATVVYPGRPLACFAYVRQTKPNTLPAPIQNTHHIRLALHGLTPPQQNAA